MAPQSKSQNERHKVILAQLLQKEGADFKRLIWFTGGGYNTQKVVTYNTLDSEKKIA